MDRQEAAMTALQVTPFFRIMRRVLKTEQEQEPILRFLGVFGTKK
jgi:hypothetical protein